MSKSLIIIPARWNSTRFPGKPLHPIAGKPLLRHVLERCQHAGKADRIIIATDDIRIAQTAFDWGAEVSLTSTHHQNGTDRTAEVVKRMKNFSIILNVQGDEPLIDPRLLDRMIVTLGKKSAIKMVTAAHPFEKSADALSPHQVKVVIDLESNALYFSRAPIPFRQKRKLQGKILRHQGVYGFRRETLLQFVKWKASPLEQTESLEQLRALENGVKIHVLITKYGSPGVDTPADALALERMLARRKGSRL